MAAVSPTISPSAPFIHVSAGAQYTCESGNLCTAVWDPVVTKWKVFKLYNCNRYSLSNWLDGGDGTYRNTQTGNPTSYFYNQSGGVITSFKPFSGQRYQNWAPVWSIRNC
ncbi:hypothetical protein [Streptomyces xiamenensis]|uniref:hypothetical protein n=1 Tax=Streptomyces xiamenensis TaxID=408015 RepID=UPI0037D6D569